MEWWIRLGLATICVYYVIMYYRAKEKANQHALQAKLFHKAVDTLRTREEYIRELERRLVETASADDLAAALNSLWEGTGDTDPN